MMRVNSTEVNSTDGIEDDARAVKEEVAMAELDVLEVGESGFAIDADDRAAMLVEEVEQHDSLIPLALYQTEVVDVAIDESLLSPDDVNTDLITTDDVVILVMGEDDDEECEDQEVIGRVMDSASTALHAHATAAATSMIATIAASHYNHDHHHHSRWTASASSALQLHQQRAEFVSAIVIKKSAKDTLGIAFSGRHSDDNDEDCNNRSVSCPNDMRIVALHKHGLLHSSPLRVGDQLLSICNKSCLELDTRTLGALLRQAKGIVSIVARNDAETGNYTNARLLETMVEKADPSSPIGIAFRRNTHGSLEVSKVIASGLFAHSLLNVGDRVIAINNVPCRQGFLSAQEAVDLCRASRRFVTILTESQGLTGVVVAAAEHDEELGGLQASAAAVPIVTPTTPKEVSIEENWERFQNNPCFCIWMIIISMSLVSLLIFDPFHFDRHR
jgi:hypothetical protein